MNLTLTDDERHISNRHPCRLETTLSPSAPITAPSLIVTGTGVQNALLRWFPRSQPLVLSGHFRCAISCYPWNIARLAGV